MILVDSGVGIDFFRERPPPWPTSRWPMADLVTCPPRAGSMKPKPRSSFQDVMVPSNRMGIVLLECSEAASRGLFVKY